LGSSEPVALHPILTDLCNQNKRLIRANRNAIGKIKLIEYQSRSFSAWVIGKQAAKTSGKSGAKTQSLQNRSISYATP
jgi:hypothetical protein